MTKITKDIISDIANLARIELSDNEKEKIAKSFGPIMEMVDQVNEVELNNEIQRDFRLKNVMRDDELREDSSQNRDAVIDDFPEKKDNYLQSKKILSN